MSIVAADVRCHELLNEIYCEPKVGVEIGVHKGDLSWRLLAANKGIFLHLVDPWEECTGGSYATTVDHINQMTQEQQDAVMDVAMQNVQLFKGQFKVHRMTSEEASEEFADESIDFVFIDGDHSYEGCSQDISLWYPKLKPGGLLSGHDYREGRNYGVMRAVDEFVHSLGKKLRLGANYTWFVTK